MPYDAVVLAGGQGRRLGGVDKPGLLVGGSSLIDTVLAASAGADRTVVVGPVRPVVRPVRWTREDPAGGGPVAALAAALPLVEADVVVLLAADLPFLDGATVERLAAAVVDDGVLLVDDRGRDQYLCSAWRTASLRRALLGVEPDGAPLRTVLEPLTAARLAPPDVPGRAAPWTDCDTPADLARAREGAGA